MYIAPNNKFCFMHINKTGGRSLVQYMRDTVPGFYCAGLGLVHKPYDMIQRLIKPGFTLVTTVRDPKERYESLYSYRQMKWANGDRSAQCKDAMDWSFNEWVIKMLNSGLVLDQPQEAWFGPNPCLIHMLRLEHLMEDVTKMFKTFEVGLDTLPEIPHINKSPRPPRAWDPSSLNFLYTKEEHLYKNHY